MTDFIFRAYDQATLDHQMSARSTVPDFMPFITAYAEESARCRAELACHIGISYGDLPVERLDIFLSRSSGPAPVFVFIHGGYWRLLDASDSSFMARTLTEAGACVVAINYGLAPATSMTEIVRQCRSAFGWIGRNIGRYGGDPERLHVSGSSAGGHLAAMCLAPGWEAGVGLSPGAIGSASILSGLLDLEPVRLSNCNAWLNMTEEEALRQSPVRHLPERILPLVVAYAPNETEEFKRQSEVYAAACAARGCPVTLLVEPGTNHFDLPMRFMDRQSRLTQSVLEIMGL